VPTNLPHEYFKAEERYSQARTVEEKVALTEEMIRLAPKHKGTEKLLRTLKRRLAKLRQELREKRERKVGRGKQAFALRKEGAAQVVLLGLPNSGKSALLKKLTAAKPQVAPHPFTTLKPIPGMMNFEDVQIQLVEAPAVVEGSTRGRGLGARPLSVARSADAIALVVDVSSDPVYQLRVLLQELESGGIELNRRPPAVSIKPRASGGIEIRGGSFVQGGEGEIKRILVDHGIHNAVVTIAEHLSAKEFEGALEKTTVYRRAFIFTTKHDVPSAREGIQKLREEFGGRFTILTTDRSLEDVKRNVYTNLGLIRVYTKPPDGEPAKRPLILPRGSRVMDVAKAVHKDFERKLKFARVWGSAKFPGQQVPSEHILEDRDIVELRI
jgi:hypothetical protein